MSSVLPPTAQPAGLCPAHRPAVPAGGLQRDTVLELPMHKRLVVQYATADHGGRELRLYHERQEISFDEPELFAFGETLARQPRFVAGTATGWGPGYTWERVGELLGQLVDAGVLRIAADDAPDGAAEPRGDDGARPSPLPPAPAAQAREWHDSEALMQELTGRALDPAHLELVIPIFRVAHMSVDAEGRQVGEANVFPPALRIEVPTRWRECIYAGTRHRSDKPMNVAALKSMRAHWGSMMALLLQVRQAYLKRYPEAAQGWTVGHLERLSTAVLALPTWLLMRAEGRVPNGRLHPALSSLFRVTDGVRMTMHQMLFVPIGEPALEPDAPMTAAEIHAYAERNYSFHSEHGVCAGPQAMVDEFLAVLVDGRTPRDGLPAALDPELEHAASCIEAALDYGLRGLQAYAVTFSLWPQMVRSYEALAAALQAWAAAGAPAVQALSARFQGHVEALRDSSYLATEDWRSHRDRVYADMLAQCTRGLAGEPGGAPLAERLQPQALPGDDLAEAELWQALQRLAGERDEAQCLAVLDGVLEHLRRVRALLAEATRVQAGINRLLGRRPPQRALEAADLDLHNRLIAVGSRPLPYLIDELQAVFDIDITVTPTTLGITSRIGRHGAGRNAHELRTF